MLPPFGRNDGLAVRGADARVIQVHVDHGLVALEADEERPARHDSRNVAGVPAVLVEEEILSFSEAQQRHGEEAARAGVLAEQDRVFALHVAPFGGEGDHAADVVPQLGRMPRDDAQVLVRDVVQQGVFGHCSSSPVSGGSSEKGRCFQRPFYTIDPSTSQNL